MSNYLGFMPTDSSEYYFVSYNNEDADRVGPVAAGMMRSGIPLWYDYGIEYGENWAAQINEKISGAKAMLLVFTQGVLEKDHSYVQKDYKIARLFRKKVIVLHLDKIHHEDVPVSRADWWVDINDNQCVNLYSFTDPQAVLREIRHALGYPEIDKSYDLYLSYAKLDTPIAEQICASMEVDGIRCFYSHRDIPSDSSDWTSEAILALQKAKILILVFTEEAMFSQRVMFEMERARREKLIILPFKLTNAVPPRIWQYQLSSIQCHSGVGKPLSESISELKHIVRVVLRNG